MPVLSSAVVRSRPRPAVGRPSRWLRLGLVLLAAAQLAVGLPALVLGRDLSGAPVHAVRESGAYMLAVAVVFLAVAARSRRLPTFAPSLLAAAALVALAAALDWSTDAAEARRLIIHAPVVAGTAVVLILALPARTRPPARGPSRP